MSDKGKCTLRLVPRQTSRRIQDTLQAVSVRQIAGLIAGQFTRNAFELLAVRQAVLDDHKELLQLDWYLHDG